MANKQRFDGPQALELARACNEVLVAKGKKIVSFRMKDEPSDDELLAAMLGPSGKLRAPALRRGKKLYVGFNDELFDSVVQ